MKVDAMACVKGRKSSETMSWALTASKPWTTTWARASVGGGVIEFIRASAVSKVLLLKGFP